MTVVTQVDLDTPLLGPVGKKAADALSTKLGLHTVGDLVRHYPRRYVDRGKLTDIAGLSRTEAAEVMRWSAGALLRAALAERRSAGPGTASAAPQPRR